MVDISINQLELTRSAYLSIADQFIKNGMGLYEAYEAVEKVTQKKGLSSRYSSFDSFKNARQREITKQLRNSVHC